MFCNKKTILINNLIGIVFLLAPTSGRQVQGARSKRRGAQPVKVPGSGTVKLSVCRNLFPGITAGSKVCRNAYICVGIKQNGSAAGNALRADAALTVRALAAKAKPFATYARLKSSVLLYCYLRHAAHLIRQAGAIAPAPFRLLP